MVPVAAPHNLGVAPRLTEVLTPAEARRRYGYAKPADAHLELRAKQHDRVFGEGKPPSDEGLIESQAYLGELGLVKGHGSASTSRDLYARKENALTPRLTSGAMTARAMSETSENTRAKRQDTT